MHLSNVGAPIVVKADGLAAGKGVTVCETVEAAVEALADIFAEPGAAAVLEEKMTGEEASLFALCDGENAVAFGLAQDHKRAFDGDRGPNTGGMGAYSPAPVATPAVEAAAMDRIVRPVLAEMARRGTPYRGVLYAGLMIEAGAPRLVEFNARFGDPETQALMLRLESDLVPLLRACATGALGDAQPVWRADAALTVTLAAKGYPGAYAKGDVLGGLDAAAAVEGVTIFHAGTKRGGEGWIANGGRVLNVSAVGATVAEARARAYRAVGLIDWPGGFHRTDIAARGVTQG
jgi:phosphoribosylamine--glycine ligase